MILGRFDLVRELYFLLSFEDVAAQDKCQESGEDLLVRHVSRKQPNMMGICKTKKLMFVLIIIN